MRGLSKTEKIMNWLRSREPTNASYGSLHLIGNEVYTYDVLLARIDRSWKRAVVNTKSYSVTSSGHRNRLLEALEAERYGVEEVESPEQIPEEVSVCSM